MSEDWDEAEVEEVDLSKEEFPDEADWWEPTAVATSDLMSLPGIPLPPDPNG